MYAFFFKLQNFTETPEQKESYPCFMDKNTNTVNMVSSSPTTSNSNENL